MDLEMVLNELSLLPLARDVYAARKRMAEFVQTVNMATKYGVKAMLRTSTDFNREELAQGYLVVKWVNDPGVERELRQLYLKIATNAPFLIDVNDSGIQESFGLSDFFWGEEQAIGLGAAFLLDALALSLRSDSCWFDSHLQLKISQIGDDGELTDTFEEIPHASHYSHIREHIAWIQKRLRSNARFDMHEGLAIWSGKEQWFPHLYFCEKVREQCQELYRGDPRLLSIMKRLYELEDYCNSWLDGPFDHTKINKATPESAATLELYGSEHTFQCHDGEFRVFSWHVRLTPGAWRIHFFPLPDERKLIIGYAGPHLNTAKFHH
ncbi:MAG: hypothetical protein ACRDIV_00680 [Ktedonobacteraceae bacterium]